MNDSDEYAGDVRSALDSMFSPKSVVALRFSRFVACFSPQLHVIRITYQGLPFCHIKVD
jgi:hypothetical protein